MAKKKKGKSLEDTVNLNSIAASLKHIPAEELGTLRHKINLYQTQDDWMDVRNEIDNQILSIKEKYGDEVYLFLLLGLRRVIEHTQRYTVDDVCDNYHICRRDERGDKFCYNYSCRYYIPGLHKR